MNPLDVITLLAALLGVLALTLLALAPAAPWLDDRARARAARPHPHPVDLARAYRRDLHGAPLHLTEWIPGALYRSHDGDGAHGPQSPDLIRAYLRACHNLDSGPLGHGKDVADTLIRHHGWIDVTNDTPRRGDVGSLVDPIPHGHAVILIGALEDRLIVFHQTPGPARIDTLPRDGLLTVARPPHPAP